MGDVVAMDKEVAPAAYYRFNPDRESERPPDHLAGFKGVIQAVADDALAERAIEGLPEGANGTGDRGRAQKMASVLRAMPTAQAERSACLSLGSRQDVIRLTLIVLHTCDGQLITSP
jgi:hypothetical protein